jgi:hypothetical protein
MIGELISYPEVPVSGIGFGFGWVTGGNMWVMTVEEGELEMWTQNFNPQVVFGDPIENTDWINSENAYDWPPGNGESWGVRFEEDGDEVTGLNVWSYNDSARKVDDWEESGYTFSWIERDYESQ